MLLQSLYVAILGLASIASAVPIESEEAKVLDAAKALLITTSAPNRAPLIEAYDTVYGVQNNLLHASGLVSTKLGEYIPQFEMTLEQLYGSGVESFVESLHEPTVWIHGDLALVYGRAVITIDDIATSSAWEHFSMAKTKEGWKIAAISDKSWSLESPDSTIPPMIPVAPFRCTIEKFWRAIQGRDWDNLAAQMLPEGGATLVRSEGIRTLSTSEYIQHLASVFNEEPAGLHFDEHILDIKARSIDDYGFAWVLSGAQKGGMMSKQTAVTIFTFVKLDHQWIVTSVQNAGRPILY